MGRTNKVITLPIIASTLFFSSSPQFDSVTTLTDLVGNSPVVPEKPRWESNPALRLDLAVASLGESPNENTLYATKDPSLQELVRLATENPELSHGRKLAGYLNVKKYQEIIALVESVYGITPGLIGGLCIYESGGNPDAKNPTSTATGIAQILRGTGEYWGMTVDGKIDERRIPETSIRVVGEKLREYLDGHGLCEYAIASYHLGPNGNIKKPDRYNRHVVECALFYIEMQESDRRLEEQLRDGRREDIYLRMLSQNSDSRDERYLPNGRDAHNFAPANNRVNERSRQYVNPSPPHFASHAQRNYSR